MKTLSVAVSDAEYRSFGFENDRLTLADFLGIVRHRVAQSSSYADEAAGVPPDVLQAQYDMLGEEDW
jgi:hypothetical protein